MTVVLDPQFPLFGWDDPWMSALDDALASTDILLCDEHEAERITHIASLGDAAQALRGAGPDLVVIKQGAEGATAYPRGEAPIHQPAIKLGDVVDTIGAGDAFDASMTLGLLRNWPIDRCLRFACVAAGMTVTGIGGSATMPTLDEVLEIMLLIAEDSE